MNIKIQSIKFDADKKLIDYVESKLVKLDKYNSDVTVVEVYLKLEPSQDGENKKVEIKVSLSGNNIFVERRGVKFEEAFDLCIDTLKVSLTKSKEKNKNI